METLRKPFQGIWNIIRFNWHLYFLAIVMILILLNPFFIEPFRFYAIVAAGLIFTTTLISLIVSFYVYDLSDLYELDWLDDLGVSAKEKMLNINAGFDEMSVLLKSRFPNAELTVFDFYELALHTEVSIKRAREAYPPYRDTIAIKTSEFPLEDESVDQIFVIFAAHEIRKEKERDLFFQELYRVLKPNGQIILTEHLRDFHNLLAYNIGFLHFITEASWRRTFQQANFKLAKEKKITQFISTFLLEKHGTTS